MLMTPAATGPDDQLAPPRRVGPNLSIKINYVHLSIARHRRGDTRSKKARNESVILVILLSLRLEIYVCYIIGCALPILSYPILVIGSRNDLKTQPTLHNR